MSANQWMPIITDAELKEIELGAEFAMSQWEKNDLGPMEDFMIENVPVLIREIRNLKARLATKTMV